MGKLILSEGAGDQAFFRHLLSAHNLSGFTIYERPRSLPAGVVFDQMLKAVKVGSEFEDVRLVVLVADCDSDPEKAFRKVLKQIRTAKGYAVPSKPREVASAEGVVDTSVLMLPWDNEQGALETVCFDLASGKRPKIGDCVQKFIDCVGVTGWEPTQISKLELRCLMAASCKGDPNTGLQYAWSPQGRRPKDLIPLNAENPRLGRIVEYLASLP